jgi:hypothetical protein
MKNFVQPAALAFLVLQHYQQQEDVHFFKTNQFVNTQIVNSTKC